MSTEDVDGPRVFVTYSHDTSEHTAQVRDFCTFLRREAGIDVRLDQWYDDGSRDWSAWAIEQLAKADFILAIASPAYKQRAEGRAPYDEGRGAAFEGAIMRDGITRNLPEETRRILSVVLPGGSIDDIPSFLRPYSVTHFVIPEFSHAGVESLLAAFSQVSKYPAPKRGRFVGNPYAELHARLQVEEQEAERARTASPTGRTALLATEAKFVRQSSDVRIGSADIDGNHYGTSIIFRPSLYCTDARGVAEFSLGRSYRSFTAVAGVLDDAIEADQIGYFQVFLDDVAQPQLRATYGKPVRITVDVTGVLRLRLLAYRPDTVVGALIAGVFATDGRSLRLPELAWGNPTLVE